MCIGDQFLLPLPHLFTFPACNGILIYRQSFIGDDKVGVDADYTSEAFTGFTCSVGIIERKQVNRRFLKADPVTLKAVRKMLQAGFTAFDIYCAAAISFIKGRLYRISNTGLQIRIIPVGDDPVDKHKNIFC